MIWHPFTPQAGAPDPLKIVRGKGEYLYDAAGNSYIDAVSSWWTMIHGHNHPQIVAAIQRQLGELDHVMLGGFTHEPAQKLAERLLALTHGDFGKVFYSDNGSTAVEVMLKLAVQYWQNCGQYGKTKFIKFDASYHGDTVGAMSAGGDSVFNRVFSSLMFEAKTFRYGDATALSELDGYLTANHETIAAIILEPLIAAAGGMVFQDADQLKQIATLAGKHHVLLILDEVFTGMGRTGEMFAYQKAGIKPDLVAIAKGLTGGVLPLAATLVSDDIHAAFVSADPAKTFYHGHTMTGNPPGCAAALASLKLFESENRLGQVKALEGKMLAAWSGLHNKFPDKIRNFRAMGGVSAVDLVSRNEKAGYVFAATQRMKAEALAAGVILRPLGNVIYVTPPYNISDGAFEKVFTVIAKILESYEI